MIKRFFAIALLSITLLGMVISSAHARGPHQTDVSNLWIFGDSLSDTGNLSALAGGLVPGPLYFNGRFSDGPVWIEPFAVKLGLTIDFDTPVSLNALANNRAIAGAYTGEDGEFGLGIGVLSQVAEFHSNLDLVNEVKADDLFVIWAGANDYFFLEPPVEGRPDLLVPIVIGNLVTAVHDLAIFAGAKRFLVLNLPDLGETALADFVMLPPEEVNGLNQLTAGHNDALAFAMAELSNALNTLGLGVEIFVIDINAAFDDVLKRQRLYGFDNVTQSCVNQLINAPDRVSTGLCTGDDDDDPLDSTGFLFWDLIHPTAATHKLIAVFTHSTLVARERLPDRIFDPERVATRIALAKLRVFGAISTLRRLARHDHGTFSVNSSRRSLLTRPR